MDRHGKPEPDGLSAQARHGRSEQIRMALKGQSTMDLKSPHALAERLQADRKRDRRVALTILTLSVAFVLLIGAAIVFAGLHLRAERARFMRQCMADHKEYECTLMWRASDRNADLPPQIIFVPTGR